MARITTYLDPTETPTWTVLTCENGDSFGTVTIGDNQMHLPLFQSGASDYARALAAAFSAAANELDTRDAARAAKTEPVVDIVTAPVVSDEEFL